MQLKATHENTFSDVKYFWTNNMEFREKKNKARSIRMTAAWHDVQWNEASSHFLGAATLEQRDHHSQSLQSFSFGTQ